MSKERLAVALVFTFCLAVPAAAQTTRRLQLQPAQPRLVKPGDTALSALSVVPTDAFGFVSVKFSKLWDNPASKPLRVWYGAQKQVPFEDMIGMKAAEIDRVTVF
jgi:hypothetical protein